MPSPTLDFYFDFISPFAYFASLRIAALAQTHGAVLAWRPVVFGALLAHWETKGPAEIPPKRVATFKTCLRYAASHGVPFEMPAIHPFKPITALRAALPEVSGRDAPRVIAALFAAGWQRGLDLGDDAVIAQALSDAGLDGAQLVARTRDDGAKAALKRSTDEAIARGVFGVPTMLVGDELFWGNDQLDYVALALQGRDPLDRERAARLLARPAGAQRRMPT
jgi:2-hydroxychromene-2-carboxylate isomerase